MTDQPHPVPQPSETNTAGTTGFILSLVFLCTGGFLSPISLVVSFFGLRKEPRGLATAGVLISGLGTLAAVVIAIVLLSAGREVVDFVETQKLREQAEAEIAAGTQLVRSWIDDHGYVPDEVEGNAILREAGLDDPWERELRFELADGQWRVSSAGPDGAIDTADDVGGLWLSR